MHDLRLVGVTQDGAHLLLRPANGAEGGEYRVPVDERLHAALRGDRARLGQLSLHQDGQITPREIQARVRAGESAESVAQSAGVPVARILRFAQPVLDERAHVADRARRGGVRGSAGEHHAASLDEALSARLGGPTGHVGHPADVDVDAFRGEDGRWSVVTTWTQDGLPRRALWSFDGSRTSVQPASDEARWLAGEIDDPAMPRPGSSPGHLAVVPDRADTEARPVGPRETDRHGSPPAHDHAPVERPDSGEQHGSALDLTADLSGHGSAPADHGEPDTAPVPVFPLSTEPPARPAGSPSGRRPRVPPLLARDTDPGRLRLSDIADHVDGPVADGDEDDGTDSSGGADRSGGAAAEPTGDTARSSRRPTMPTWDEIMFGRRRHD